MSSYLLLTRLIREEIHPTFAIVEREKKVKEKLQQYLPDVTWHQSYAVLGPWDYVDVFTARNEAEALQVSILVRFYGGTHTELWPIKDWESYKESIRDLAQIVEK